jgi:hypothetical protein
MEINFSLQRLLLLFALLALFAALGGFACPSLPPDSILNQGRVTKAWSYCVLLFIAGAVCASLVDHFVGNIDRSNIRFLYLVIGSLLMIGSYFWIRSLHETAARDPKEMSNNESTSFFMKQMGLGPEMTYLELCGAQIVRF